MDKPHEDPIINEVREARCKLLADAEASGKSLLEYVLEAQKQHPDRVVYRGPPKAIRKTGSFNGAAVQKTAERRRPGASR